MSFLSSIFGGEATRPVMPAPPKMPLAAPTISSGMVEAADREAQARLRQRKGTEKTILGGGLGDSAPQANIARNTLLGGSGTV